METAGMIPRRRSERGIALPVMLIMLTVMLVGSIYLFKASNSTSMTTANLAYESQLSKAAELGLHTAFQWLNDTALASKNTLNNNSAANGYLATLNTALTPSSTAFWTGSVTITDGANNQIEYVVHRMCALAGAYDATNNTCVQTSAAATLGVSTAIGDSLASDAPSFAVAPQVHYVITSRIYGPRGGNVVNQMVVLIGA
jgi:Tfp pilus assembly protein PilX